MENLQHNAAKKDVSNNTLIQNTNVLMSSGAQTDKAMPSFQPKIEAAELKQPATDGVTTESDTQESREKIIDVVREIHQTAKECRGVDPQCFENDDTRYAFKGTEEQLCNLIREVIFEDEETKAYAVKTDTMLKQWDEALTREEGWYGTTGFSNDVVCTLDSLPMSFY